MLLSTMRAADEFHGRLQAVASHCAAAPMERHVR
jgi:hypothetical protein